MLNFKLLLIYFYFFHEFEDFLIGRGHGIRSFYGKVQPTGFVVQAIDKGGVGECIKELFAYLDLSTVTIHGEFYVLFLFFAFSYD